MIGETNCILEINAKKTKYEQLINYTMLYDYGDECTNITGGYTGRQVWKSYSSGFFQKQNDCLFYGRTTDSYGSGMFYSNNSLDVSQYTSVSSFNNVYAKAGTNLNYYWAGLGYARNSVTTSDPNAFVDASIYRPFKPQNVSVGTNFFINLKTSVITSGNSQKVDKTNCKICPMSWCGGDSNQKCSIKTYAVWLNKQDDWQKLCTTAGLNSSDYTDEDTLCTDSSAITTILNNEKAVEFMIYNCTGSFMSAFISSSTCLTALNNSQYKTIVQANEHWNKFLSMVA